MTRTEAATLAHDIGSQTVVVTIVTDTSVVKVDPPRFKREDLKCLAMFGFVTRTTKHGWSRVDSIEEYYRLTALGLRESGLKFPMLPSGGYKGQGGVK